MAEINETSSYTENLHNEAVNYRIALMRDIVTFELIKSKTNNKEIIELCDTRINILMETGLFVNARDEAMASITISEIMRLFELNND